MDKQQSENSQTNLESDEIVDLNEYKFPSLDLKFNFMITFWIPRDCAGKVIGKKGLIVANLSRETQTFIYVKQVETSKSLWIPVTINGEPKSCQVAYNKIKSLVDDEVDESVIEFFLNPLKHSQLIGSKGMRIRKLSADYNIRIYIPSAKEETGSITFEGDADKCFNAYFEIFSTIFYKEDKNAGYRNKDNFKGDSNADKSKATEPLLESINNTTQKQPSPPPLSQQQQQQQQQQRPTPPPQPQQQPFTTTTSSNSTSSPHQPLLPLPPPPPRHQATADLSLAQLKAEVEQLTMMDSKKLSSSSPISDANANQTPRGVLSPSSKLSTQNLPGPYTPSSPKDYPTLSQNPDATAATATATATAAATQNYTLKRNITIPSSIVGLLLVVKKNNNVSVLNSIQRSTQTRISRIDASGETEGVRPVDTTVENVPFLVTGNLEENIEKACQAISRIVSGERIAEVLQSLNLLSKKNFKQLKSRENKNSSRNIENKSDAKDETAEQNKDSEHPEKKKVDKNENKKSSKTFPKGASRQKPNQKASNNKTDEIPVTNLSD